MYPPIEIQYQKNNVIIEGIWGIGRTTVLKDFRERFEYTHISEPSHLTLNTDQSVDLQQWYRKAHLQQEEYLFAKTPHIIERSILSVFAFEYAQDGKLPSSYEIGRFREVLEKTKTLLVYLSPDYASCSGKEQLSRVGESIQRILMDEKMLKRYFEFYETILPWKYDIVPLIIPTSNEQGQRDPGLIASEIRTAIGAQRVAQVNVVCIDESSIKKDPRILMMRRTPQRGGFWQTVTGGIHPGEPLAKVVIREVQEETAIHLEAARLLPSQYSHSFLGNDGYMLTEYVFGAFIENLDMIQRSDEHDELRWVSAAEARQLMSYESNRVALNHVLASLVAPQRA